MREKNRTGRRNGNRFNHHARHLLMTAAGSALLVHAGVTLAQSTYTGPSGTASAPTTGDWNTATNWSPTGVPAGGPIQTLTFGGGSTVYTSTDDIAGTFALNQLSLGDAGSTLASSVGTNILSFQGTNPTITQTTAGTFTVSAPVDLPTNTAVSQINGGEIDFTGPVTSSATNGLTLTNSSGTGNSTVKFFGANTFGGLTVNPNVTAAAAQSASSTSLGAGTVTLSGGTLALQGYLANGVVQHPIGVAGFNADTILDANAGNTIAASPGVPAHTGNATVLGVTYPGGSAAGQVYTSSFNIATVDMSTQGGVHNNTVLFQNGWNGKTDGLPASGTFTSLYTNTATGGHTGFNFAYNGSSVAMAQNNTLYFAGSNSSGGTSNPSSGTLTLAAPSTSTSSLDFLAAAELPSGYTTATQFDVTLNFADGTHDTYTKAITTGPLGGDGVHPNPSNIALGSESTGGTGAASYIKGSDNGNSGHTDNGASGVVFTENDIQLSTADQGETINSITFTPDNLDGVTAAIYAVSGVGSATNVLQGSQTYANNVIMTASSTINVSGSLQATMGNLNIGSNTLTLASSDTTASPYGLTLGTINIAGNPTFSVSNSSGGGVGTLSLGSLNDQGTATNITIGSGIVTVTAAASSLVAGSTINVPATSTLNLNSAGAWGGTGTVLNVSGGTVNLGATGAINNVSGGIINITSGTLNGNLINGIFQAQVNMSGGVFNVNTPQQVSSLSGIAGTVNLNGYCLTIGNNIDNLSSTFAGQILGFTAGNPVGSIAHEGTGTLTLTNTANTQAITEINNGAIVASASPTVTAGIISGEFGNGVILVGDGGTPQNSFLELDAPGRTIPNTIYFASGTHGIAGVGGAPGTGEETIAGLNTTGVVTLAGDVVLGSGSGTLSGAGSANGTQVIAASNGGEVDITGNLIANHDLGHTPLTIRNLSQTGSAVVKTFGQNNTWAGGTEIDPGVTFVATLSGSNRMLGYGPISLVGGTLAIQGQQTTGTELNNLVTNTGFNQKIIVPIGAASAAAATTSTIDGSQVLYEKGFVNSLGTTGPTGLNTTGLYASEYNPSVQFQLQPYTGNTALSFKSGNTSAGTLTLATPSAFQTVNVLSMNGPLNAAVTFNFGDGSTETQYINTQGWYYGQSSNVTGGAALASAQRLAVGGTDTSPTVGQAGFIGSVTRSATADVFTEYPAAMYEDDFTLSPTDQSKTLDSISFNASAASLTALGGASANIMAISGLTYVAPTTLSTQTYVNNVAVTNANATSGTINVTGSLNAIMGNNLKIGDNTLSVVSSDGTTGPYSLTLATLPDTLDTKGTAPEVTLLGSTPGQGPTFNVSNSAGGGAGTLVLGALDDSLALAADQVTPVPQTITKIGAGSLTLSAPAISLQAGTVINVNAGTVNSNDPLAMGTLATVNVTATLNFGANDNTGTSPVPVTLAALNVSGTGLVAVLNANSSSDRTVLVITGSNNLSIATGGKLDLNGNDLIVQGGSLATITAELKSGYNAGQWNGLGIASTSASRDSTHLHALGVMASSGASFDGQSTSAGDVLVKYTYYGDANLDGKVDGSDYSLIDNSYLVDQTTPTAYTGWANGDFNYDGVIDGSDYTLIDNAYNSQGSQITSEIAAPTAEIAGGSGTSAVPEPTALALLGIGAVGLLGRRSARCRLR